MLQLVPRILYGLVDRVLLRGPHHQILHPLRDLLLPAVVHVGEGAGPIDQNRLSDFCHVLFNSNQFLYLE